MKQRSVAPVDFKRKPGLNFREHIDSPLPDSGLLVLVAVEKENLPEVIEPEEGDDPHGIAHENPIARQQNVLAMALASGGPGRQVDKRQQLF